LAALGTKAAAAAKAAELTASTNANQFNCMTAGEIAQTFNFSLPIVNVDLSVTKTAAGQISPGGQITYTVTASNAGPATATGATVTDTFPAALSACSWPAPVAAGGATGGVAGAGNLNQAVNLPSGGSLTYTITCTVAGGNPTVTNTATVAAPGGTVETNPANNTASATSSVAVSGNADQRIIPPSVIQQQQTQADLSLTQMGNGGGGIGGGNIGAKAYMFTVVNNGPIDGVEVELLITIPAGLQVVRSMLPDGCSVRGSSVSGGMIIACYLGTLGAGSSAVRTINVYGMDLPSSLRARVASDSPDLNPGNNSVR
jgi:uncharacterized repeat protein (TIGR01451 family)